MNIYVENSVWWHTEIIESLFTILLAKFGIDTSNMTVYLKIEPNDELQSYLTNKYSNIILVKAKPELLFAYEIYATFYPEDIDSVSKKSTCIYISHRVDEVLTDISNVYYLTPLCGNNKYIIPSMLPEITRIKTAMPIFVVQGNITEGRRNYRSLLPIFEAYKDVPFKIKFIGRGQLPHYLYPYANKIVLKRDLPFLQYHHAFADAFGILTLIDDTFNHGYYESQLTSSISYGIGYNLLFIASNRLKDIYGLEKCIPYSSQAEMVSGFKKAIDMFYLE